MQKPLSLCVMLLMIEAIATTLSGPDRDLDERIKDQFVGAWRLVSLEAPGPDRKIQTADSTGMFVFTRYGHASVQVVERNPAPQAAVGAEQYSRGGYEATFRAPEVDETAHMFTFHVEGAFVRTLIGKGLP
jgi:hypothetical protein